MALPPLPAEAAAALRRFRAFYEDLFTLKAILREGDWAALLGGRAADLALDEQVTRAVQLRLRRVIAAQGFAAGVTPAGGSGRAGIDPGYVMAAVADEALLHDVAWPGAALWARTPLEEVLYRSRIAGDRIFLAVDPLLRARGPDLDGLAMTILLALQMGFRGRYHGQDDHGEIARLRERLFELVFGARYAAEEDPGELVVGAAEPLAGLAAPNLPTVRPWAWAIGAVVVGYLVIGWLIWLDQVGPTLDTARGIVAAVRGLR